MKKMLLITLLLMLSYGFAKGDCLEGCDDPPWTLDSTEWDIGETGCWIWAKYEYRTVTCNGVPFFELRLVSLMAAININCGALDFPNILLETTYSHLIMSGVLPNEMPDEGECISTFRFTGPSCWELVTSAGSNGSNRYLSPCAANPQCCRHYMMCKYEGVLSLYPLSYIPVPCGGVIGPHSHLPCISNCQ
jgi:hypothetical protein